MAEYLAYEILSRVYPQAFDGAPVTVVEHYARDARAAEKNTTW